MTKKWFMSRLLVPCVRVGCQGPSSGAGQVTNALGLESFGCSWQSRLQYVYTWRTTADLPQLLFAEDFTIHLRLGRELAWERKFSLSIPGLGGGTSTCSRQQQCGGSLPPPYQGCIGRKGTRSRVSGAM